MTELFAHLSTSVPAFNLRAPSKATGRWTPMPQKRALVASRRFLKSRTARDLQRPICDVPTGLERLDIYIYIQIDESRYSKMGMIGVLENGKTIFRQTHKSVRRGGVSSWNILDCLRIRKKKAE